VGARVCSVKGGRFSAMAVVAELGRGG